MIACDHPMLGRFWTMMTLFFFRHRHMSGFAKANRQGVLSDAEFAPQKVEVLA